MEPKHIKQTININLPYPRVREELVGKPLFESIHRKLISSFYENIEENIYEEVSL